MSYSGVYHEVRMSKNKELLSRPLPGKIIIGILLFIGILILAVVIYFYGSQIVTVVEPKEINAILPAGDWQTGSITIQNLGIFPENINVSFNNESWINMQEDDFNFSITPKQVRIINYYIKVPLYASVGNYINIIYFKNSNNDIAEIPVLINVLLPAQFQATIDAPEKINKTGFYKVDVVIHNLGGSPVYGVNLT